MKRLIASLVVLLLIAISSAPAPSATNPFFTPSTLPFGAPPFDRIKDSDYLPAFRAGIAQQAREYEAIANNPAPPTFANTFVAMEKAGMLLYRVSQAFAAVSQANTNDTLQNVQATISPELAEAQDAIYLNPKLFARVQSVYNRLGTLKLDPESQQLVRVDYQNFVLAGANLNPAAKAKMRDIDKKLSILQAAFDRKLLAATAAGAVVVTKKADLAGMSDAAIASIAKSGKWRLAFRTRRSSRHCNRSTTATCASNCSWRRGVAPRRAIRTTRATRLRRSRNYERNVRRCSGIRTMRRMRSSTRWPRRRRRYSNSSDS